MSGKSSVGKSLVTALLAVDLVRQGKRVGILDADVTGSSIPHLFGLRDKPLNMAWGMMPVESGTGIKVISTNLLLDDEDQAVIWCGPLIEGLIRRFWTEVVWGRLDYLLVDLPPGTADAPLTVMQALASALALRLLAQIPIDPEISRLCDTGQIEQYSDGTMDRLTQALLSERPNITSRFVQVGWSLKKGGYI